MRLLLNLFFYYFNHFEPHLLIQYIELLDVITAFNQLNRNSLCTCGKLILKVFIDISQILFCLSNFLIGGN